MTKFREDRIHEIYSELSKNKKLYSIYLKELDTRHDEDSRRSDYFQKIEDSYKKAKERYESI